MSINHGAGGGGVGSATEPGPTVNVGDADSGLYANNNPTSQAGNDALSFERVRKMVQGAVDNIKFEARYGSPLSDAPGVEEFRRQYYALMCQVRDGEHRAYIKKRLKVAWAWAGDHQPRRLRDQRGYSLILRDKIFQDGELRADLHHIGWGTACTEPPPKKQRSEQPGVRAVSAVHVTAGHNALRGSGPGQNLAFDNALAQVGCPDRRIDRLCITCCSPSQPSHHADLGREVTS